MAESKSYIEQCLSISKEGYDEPWRMEIKHPFDNNKKVVYYLENEKHPVGTLYNLRPIVEIGANMEYVMQQLLERIERYPYYWPLENQKIDPYGYDFWTTMQKGQENENNIIIELTEGADTLIREKLSISLPVKEAWRPLEAEDYVEGTGAGIRMEILLEKAGPVNHLALELFSAREVEIKALMYQEDIKQYSPVKELIIENIESLQSNRSITLNFPKPIFAKRIIVILVQKEYAVNRYALPKNIVAQKKILKYIKDEEARKTAEDIGSVSYQTDYKTDSFADAFIRSGLKSYADLMKDYKKKHEDWLKSQKKK